MSVLKEIDNNIVNINRHLMKLLPIFDKNSLSYQSVVDNEYR